LVQSPAAKTCGSEVRLVHRDAVLATQARGGGERDVGQDADADDDQVRRKLAVAAGHCAHASLALERGDRGVAQDAHAGALVQARIESRKFGRHDPVHRPVGHFEHRHLEAEVARARRRLEPDVPSADDHELLRPRQVGADRVDVCDGAQVMDAGEIVARYLQSPRSAADAQ
jgi:hypothetical protein